MSKILNFILNIIILFLTLIVVLLFFIEIPVVNEEGSIKVYFTYQDDVENIFLKEIESAKEVKCAFYDISDELLLYLKKENAEIVLHNKSRRALMHNKFCILDKTKIITGSLNPTFRGFNKNNNNLLIIESKSLANNYLDEFNELNSGILGGGKITWNNKIVLSGILIENYFCPEDNCKEKVMRLLSDAKESIYFMTFSFTDNSMSELIYQKAKQNVEVKGIFEKTQASNIYSEYNKLKNYSVLDSNKFNMHHKVFIIDNEILITGSYNPTQNGDENNDENIIIIHDKEIARQYLNEFENLYKQPITP